MHMYSMCLVKIYKIDLPIHAFGQSKGWKMVVRI